MINLLLKKDLNKRENVDFDEVIKKELVKDQKNIVFLRSSNSKV